MITDLLRLFQGKQTLENIQQWEGCNNCQLYYYSLTVMCLAIFSYSEFPKLVPPESLGTQVYGFQGPAPDLLNLHLPGKGSGSLFEKDLRAPGTFGKH